MLVDINKLPSESNTEVISPKFTNVDLNMKSLSDRLSSIGELSSDEIRQIIFNKYHLFLDDIYLRNEKQRGEIIKAFTTPQFIREFIVMSDYISLTGYQQRCINKICWDTISIDSISDEIKELILQLSCSINRQIIQILSAKIPLYWAKMIALARNSSFNEHKEMRRVNSMIIKMELNDLQTIVDIYSILFNQSLTKLFITVALDIRDYNSMNERQIHTDKLLSIAVFEILNTVPSDIITTVLRSYAETLKLKDSYNKIRFEMNCDQFKKNYIRIAQIMDLLYNDGVIIP